MQRAGLAAALVLAAVLGLPAGGLRDAFGGEEEAVAAELRARAKKQIERSRAAGHRAPDFGAGKQWLNTARPLTLRGDLAGKVVLIDFWTYCCINCIHVLDELKYLERKYAGEPFVVVGCHSAKFANEAEAENIRQAVLRLDIEHPVVVDEDFEIWRSYGARSWPTLVLVGPDGLLLAKTSGEGRRDLLDALIGEALDFYGARKGALSPKAVPVRLERERSLGGDLSFPGKISVGPEGGKLYISDTDHHRIVVTTLDGKFLRAFGSGREGFEDGSAESAAFRRPGGLAFVAGDLLVADTGNHAIRSVDLGSGRVATVAGTGRQGRARRGIFAAREADLSSPWALLALEDRILVAMAGPHQIWSLDLEKGRIGPFAGDGSERKADGSLSDSAFAQPSGLALGGETVYVADSESSAIRTIDLDRGRVATLAGGARDPRDLFHFGDEDGAGLGRRFQHPLGVLLHDGILYVADTYNHKIKTVDLRSGEVKAFAGTGKPGSADGPRDEATFYEPSGLTAAGGRLYVADTNNHAIRILGLESGTVSTLDLTGVPEPAGKK